MCHFWAQNGPFALIKFCWCKPLLLLSSTYWLFSLCKIKKNPYSRSRVMRMRHFWGQIGPFDPNFFWKIINIILIYLLASRCAKLKKKFFQRIHSYEDVQFLSPKWPIFPNEFFRKPVNEPFSFHSKQDINLLVKH